MSGLKTKSTYVARDLHFNMHITNTDIRISLLPPRILE
jgi:hypothetical protein